MKAPYDVLLAGFTVLYAAEFLGTPSDMALDL